MFFYIESYHLLDYYYGNQNVCSFNIILHIFLWKTQKHNVRIWTTDIYKVAEIRTPYQKELWKQYVAYKWCVNKCFMDNYY